VTRLTRPEFALPAEDLAPALLGCTLVRLVKGRRRAGIIVETEAYLGEPDLSSHAVGGRRTARTESMFGAPGTAYVYFTYGMHHCMNVSAHSQGVPEAVLIRALEPVEGIGAMRAARGAGARTDRDLCSGPAKLCQALQIDRALSGVDMTLPDAHVFIEAAPRRADARGAGVERGPRIGLAGDHDWIRRPLRFWLGGNAHVSR